MSIIRESSTSLSLHESTSWAMYSEWSMRSSRFHFFSGFRFTQLLLLHHRTLLLRCRNSKFRIKFSVKLRPPKEFIEEKFKHPTTLSRMLNKQQLFCSATGQGGRYEFDKNSKLCCCFLSFFFTIPHSDCCLGRPCRTTFFFVFRICCEWAKKNWARTFPVVTRDD